jgi:ParB/RepB/Spo0J family partition protein
MGLKMSEIEKEAKIWLIPLRKIKPLPLNVNIIDHETDKMLLEDMRRNPEGIDPIIVRRLTPEEREASKEKYPFAEYEIIDGHKRFANAQLLHWDTIPARVLEVSREEAFETNYRKNRERGTVDPMAEALYFKHLYIDQKMKAEEIASKFNLSEDYVRKVLARVGIKPEVARRIMMEARAGHQLTGKHLEAIAKAPEEKQEKVVEAIIKKGLSAKEAKLVVNALTKKPEAEALLELPKPKLIEEARKIVMPPPASPKPEEEKVYVCPVCGSKLKLVENALVPVG